MAYQPRRAIFFPAKPVQAARMESGARGNRKGILMKRLLGSTAALSLVLTSVQPFPLLAQEAAVQCDMSTGENCTPEELAAIQAAAEEAARAEAEAQAAAEEAARAQAEAEAQAAAEEAARAQAEAEAQAAAEEAARAQAEAEAQAAAEEAARAQAEAEAQAAAEEAARAQAEAEAQAAAEAAQAEADAKAAEEAAQAEADAKAAEEAAQAEADAKAAEEAAQAEADAKAAEEAAQAEADAKAAEEAAQAEEPATGEAPANAGEQPADDPAMTDEAAAEEPAADAAPAEEPAAEEQATEEPAMDSAATGETAPEAADPATEDATPAEDTATPQEPAGEPAATEDPAASDTAAEEAAPPTLTLPEPAAEVADPSAGLATAEPDPAAAADVTPVEAPQVTEAEVETLSEILANPDAVQPGALEAAAAFAPPAAPAEGEKPKLEDLPVPADAKVVIETLTDKDTRKSGEEFAAAPKALGEGKKSGLSDLEKAGLVVLGALVVGAIINEGRKDERRVVSNTGDRIVVLKPDGTYDVYKDDDATLRRPGSTVRTETYRDGSTRTVVERPDGTQIVTVRDASGRVLRRAQYDRLGREIVLIDDMWEEEPVVVSKLPKPRKERVTISTKDDNAALKAALAAKEARKAGRSFTLRQIREIPEVRALAATIDVQNVTFDTGSAAIKAGEADNLAELGSLMQDLLEANPGEVFLIEGHTDATGDAAMNLALSDRRAESVALALTEYFDIPPENMVVQGYGESELLIPTQKDERRNRRVVVRVITPLMKTAK
jgi:outer membrane protein OmpA-like peptidoglycan-associated protein